MLLFILLSLYLSNFTYVELFYWIKQFYRSKLIDKNYIDLMPTVLEEWIIQENWSEEVPKVMVHFLTLQMAIRYQPSLHKGMQERRKGCSVQSTVPWER